MDNKFSLYDFLNGLDDVELSKAHIEYTSFNIKDCCAKLYGKVTGEYSNHYSDKRDLPKLHETLSICSRILADRYSKSLCEGFREELVSTVKVDSNMEECGKESIAMQSIIDQQERIHSIVRKLYEIVCNKAEIFFIINTDVNYDKDNIEYHIAFKHHKELHHHVTHMLIDLDGVIEFNELYQGFYKYLDRKKDLDLCNDVQSACIEYFKNNNIQCMS